MVKTGIFAFSIFVNVPCVLAQINLNTHVEINQATNNKRIMSTQMQLSADEPIMIQKDKSDTIRLEEQLLSENETEARVCCIISEKNADGEYEVISRPEFSVSYSQAAKIEIVNTNGKSLRMILKANRI